MPNLFKNISNATVSTLIKAFGLDNIAFADGKGKAKDNIEQMLNKALGELGVTSAFHSAYQAFLKTEVDRRKQYREYDTMDDESDVITTALDIYSEDSTDFDTFMNSRIWVTSNNEKYAKDANELLKKLKIEKNLPKIARNLAKYGDFFLRLVTDKDPKNKSKTELVKIDTSYYPRDIMPIIKDYKLLGYWVMDQESMMKVEKEQLFPPWEFVHFAIPGDSNFVTYDLTSTHYQLRREDTVEYGQSMLKAARRPYKRSKMMHDILAIARMTRSPLKRIFKFMTETNNPIKAITDLAIFKKTMEKIGGVDKVNDHMEYEELMNVLTQDIYLPVMKDAKGDYSFDSVGGEVEVSSIADIDMWDNRLFMSIRIPKEFMNFGESIGEKTTLLLKDIRYSKRIKKLQNAIKAGVRELIFIHFALNGTILHEGDFDVNMASTSLSEDLERLDYFGNAVQTADSLIRMLETFTEGEEGEEGEESSGKSIDKGYLIYYIMKHVVKLPSFDITKFYSGAQKYIDAESKENESTRKETAKNIVESNRKLIDSIARKNFGTELQEAAEAVNVNVEKDYRKKILIPEKFDHASLTEFCKSIIAQRKEEKKK